VWFNGPNEPLMASIRPDRPTLLVVDDDPAQSRALAALLGEHGYGVEIAASAPEAIARVAGGGIDLVLLDARLPANSAVEACATVKRMSVEEAIPVLLCVGRGDASARVQGMLAGADDHVGRPVEPRELAERVRALLRVREAHRAMAKATAELERARMIDAVTGCRTFAGTRERLAADFARAEARHEPLACAMLDVDHLKLANERDGREGGDRVLYGVAQVVQKSLRDTDAVGRYGADELMVLLPGAHFAGASKAATRIFRDVTARLKEFPLRPALSLSMGVALYPTREVRTLSQLLLAAHGALEKAKREGGDQLCVLQQEGLWYTVRGTVPEAPPSSTGASQDPRQGGAP
jgi:diguanylate cyclase (GGDEF)-like protein